MHLQLDRHYRMQDISCKYTSTVDKSTYTDTSVTSFTRTLVFSVYETLAGLNRLPTVTTRTRDIYQIILCPAGSWCQSTDPTEDGYVLVGRWQRCEPASQCSRNGKETVSAQPSSSVSLRLNRVCTEEKDDGEAKMNHRVLVWLAALQGRSLAVCIALHYKA